MIDKKRNATAREWVQEQESRYKQEILAVVLIAIFVFLSLAFFSYSAQDNTLFHYVNSEEPAVPAEALCEGRVANWAGLLGSNIAALFFFLLGSAAYIFLASLLFPIYLLLFKVSFAQEWRRVCLLQLFVVITAMLCALYQIDVVGGVPGGFLGSIWSNKVLVLAGQKGGHLVLWGMLWIIAIMLLRLPLMPMIMVALCYAHAFVIQVVAWGKSKFVQKSDAHIIQDGAHVVRDASPEDLFTMNELEIHADSNSFSAPVQTSCAKEEATSDKFITMHLRKSSVSRKVMGTIIAQLPNTVLSHNPCLIDRLLIKTTINKSGVFQLPDASLFNPPSAKRDHDESVEEGKKRAQKVEEKLNHFGVKGTVVAIKPGPVVTLFEYKPEIDSKISKIVALEDDLAMALTAQSMRIIAPIPGKNAVGFEIANNSRDDVSFTQIFTSAVYEQTKAKLPIVLGVDVVGNPIVDDLATTPHLLVGGATGSGKSVGLNVMLISLLCKLSPDNLKLILIDPKRLEFTPYAHIPHLLFPIVTQPARAAGVLSWVVQEMEERYEAMAAAGVRNFSEYRQLPSAAHEEVEHRKAYLVVIIDELADLMMVAGKEVETQIVRIAQMARAAGIHLIVATQRPSVDVVTGLIKVNFPSRVAFRVSSKVDSRTILDLQGAEKLLGRGDMLYMHASSPELKRVHGAYVSDREIERVADFLRDQQQAQYLDLHDVLKRQHDANREELHDELYGQVCEFVKTADEISISMIQRHYRIGFNRSARLIEKLETDGLIAPAQGSKPRKVIR